MEMHKREELMQAAAAAARTGVADKGKAIRTARWEVVLAVVVLALGLGATAWVVHSQYLQEQQRIEREFQQMADKWFGGTLREVQLFMEVLDSIRHLHSLSDQVPPEAFEELVRKGMIYQRRILRAYGFAQLIPHGMRADYEKQTGVGRAIVSADGQGGFVPVPKRKEYFPLTYQTPPGGLGVPPGYDFGVRSEDAAAIEAMVKWNVFALGGAPVGTMAGGEEQAGLFMFAPISYGTGSNRELVGFAIGLFQPQRVLAAAMGESIQGIQARLEPLRGGGEAEAPGGPWRFQREFSLADQEWRFTAEAGPEYRAAVRTRTPELAGGIGALISVALAGALLLIAGRSRRVERLVRRRTAELAEANAKLEDLMEERRELEDEVLRISGHEKARIGRDLHDSLGQKLTGVMYLFGAYRQRIEAADDAMESDAAQIAATLKESVSQVRRIARGLAPVALTEDGLPDALRRLAEESAVLFQKSIEFYAEREGRPRDTGTAEHVYLIAQEALHNAAWHSGGQRIILTLDYTEEGGELAVEDNGHGFSEDKPASREGGNGLRIMRHRAEVFGGELTVEPRENGGIRVLCRFPKA